MSPARIEQTPASPWGLWRGRQLFGRAVDGAAGGGENELLHVRGHAHFKQVQRATHVDVGVEDRVGHAAPHVDLRREVGDYLRLLVLKHVGQLGRAYVELVKPGLRVEIVLRPGGKIIHHRHLVSGVNIGIHHMGTDKTGASCNQNLAHRV
jgi:hypothetical protein